MSKDIPLSLLYIVLAVWSGLALLVGLIAVVLLYSYIGIPVLILLGSILIYANVLMLIGR